MISSGSFSQSDNPLSKKARGAKKTKQNRDITLKKILERVEGKRERVDGAQYYSNIVVYNVYTVGT